MFRTQHQQRRLGYRTGQHRRGAGTLDYVLLLAVVLPMLGLTLKVAPLIMSTVFEMTSVLVSWPFM